VACHQKHTNFYRCTIESILSGCITTWYGNCSAHTRKALQMVVWSAQRIPGANYLPSRTPTPPNVTGRPKRSSRTPTTQATACSPRYHAEGEVSTGASKLGPRDLRGSFVFFNLVLPFGVATNRRLWLQCVVI
jgi:hypothetical protein